MDPRLGDFAPQRNSALFRSAERQQRHTYNGRDCDCRFFKVIDTCAARSRPDDI